MSEIVFVDYATTAALPSCTYSNGTAGVGATLTASGNGAITLDGVTPSALSYRDTFVLVKDQADAKQNGIYFISQFGDGSHPFILARSSLDPALTGFAGVSAYVGAANGFESPFVVGIAAGTANKATLWIMESSASIAEITFGTDTITFIRANSGAAGGGGTAGGTGLFNQVLSPTPTQANTGFTAWANQPTSSLVNDGATGMAVFEPSQSNSHTLAVLKKDVSGLSTPYSFTVLMASSNQARSYGGGVFGWTTNTPGACLTYTAEYENQMGVGLYSGLTAPTLTWKSGGGGSSGHPFMYWIKLLRDSTKVYFYFSMDGVNWRLEYSENISGGSLASYGNLVFGCNNYSQEGWTTMLSFAQGTS